MQPILAVSGLIIHENRVLLVKRKEQPGKGYWSLPGGKLELGETMEQALLRELQEELGILIRIQELLGVYDAIGPGYHFVIACYRAQALCTELRPGSDVLDAGWFSRDQLLKLELTSTCWRALKDAGFI